MSIPRARGNAVPVAPIVTGSLLSSSILMIGAKVLILKDK